MTRRMIDSSMWQNEKFQELPMCARLLQVSLINAADDQGRVKATPKFIKVQVFPYDDIPIDDIQEWLEAIQENGTIILYTSDGKQYAQFTNWWKYQALQYAQPSQFPRPEGWLDRIRRTATKGFIATCNWYTVDGARLDDTCDQDGNPLVNPKPKASKSPVSPVGNQPMALNGSGESSPVHSGESSPVHSGEGTILTKEEFKRETTTTPAREAEPIVEKPNSGSGGGGFPNTRHRQSDQEYARLCQKFESEGFGTLTQILAEEINALMNEYPTDWIDDAMTVSVEANKRQLRYTRGILVRWRAQGRNDKRTIPGQAPPVKEVLPFKKWCLDRYNTTNAEYIPGIPEALIHEQYEQYRKQYQQAH